MKKYISIILTIVIAFNISTTSFALIGFTDETGFITDGNGTITAYNGIMSPYATIQIPEDIDGETITAIGDNFLKDNTDIAYVIIPAGVTSIGDNAFSGCINLSEALFLSKNGDSVAFGTSAFTNVSDNLQMRGYPNSPASVFASENVITYSNFEDDFAFNADTQTITGFTGFNTVTVIPNEIGGVAVTAIGDNAFGSSSLGWHVYISEGIDTIGSSAFEQNSLRTVYLPSTLTSIGAYAFQYSGLREITISSSITSMGIYAFGYCCYLTNITLEDGLSTLGSASTFYGCLALENITIPSSITVIPGETFKYCIKLSSVDFPSNLTYIGVDAFSNCEDLASINLPDSLTTISANAFRGCNSLSGTTVTIPKNVMQIGNYAFYTGNDDNALITPQSDLSVTNITLKIENGYKEGDLGALTMGTNIMSSNGSHNNSIEAYPMSSAFNYANGISTLAYTPIYTNETDFVFAGGIITGYTGTDKVVNIPDTINLQPVIGIGDGAFSNNPIIEEVIIPETVASIGSNAFANCLSLFRTTIYGNTTIFGSTPFNNVNPSFVINALDGSDAYYYALNNSLQFEELQEFTLSGESGAYLLGTGIRPTNGVIIVPNTLKGSQIDTVVSCESNNTTITGLVIPEGITTLGTQAYPLPKYLKSITLPDSLVTIYNGAFNNSTYLETITVSETNNNYSVDSNVLFNKDQTTLIKYPANKTGTTYEVGSNVTAISDSAFQSSQNLNSVAIKNSACNIGQYAFYDMPSGFTIYGYAGSTAETFAANNGLSFSPLTVNATGINVKTSPTKTVYNEGDSLDLSGMVVTLTQETAPTSIDVSFADFDDYQITVNPVNGTVLGTSDNTITVTCNSHSTTQAITVNELPTQSIVSYNPVTLTQTGDIANNNVQYQDVSQVISALPESIIVTLEDSTTVSVPVTWTDTDSYNASVAADYTFTASWGMLPTGVDNDDQVAAPTCEVTVAQGTLPTYTVTFNEGLTGATQVQDYTNVVTGSTIARPTDPTIDGYNFSNWYKTNNRINIWDFDTDVVSGDITLFGQWNSNIYYVSFNGNGSTSGAMSNQEFTYNQAEDLNGNSFLRTGYNFNGWNTQIDGNGTDYSDGQNVNNLTTVNNDVVTLYAKWTPQVLAGDVSVIGDAKYGETLTADVTGITNNTGTLSYQWKRGSDIINGATSSTYTLEADDINNTISVVVNSDIQTGSIISGVTSNVVKADVNVPATPTLNTKTDTTITINSDTANEYAIRKSTDSSALIWVSATSVTYQFTGLTENTAYNIYTRVKETATHNVSGESAPLSESTLVKAVNNISITTPPNKVTYNEGDTLDLSGLVVTVTYSDTSSDTISENEVTANPANGSILNDTDVTSVIIEYGGKSDTQAITINPVIIENQIPVVANQISDQTAIKGETYNFTFAENTFTDADGDILTYSANPLPEGISFTSETRTFSGAPITTGATIIVVTAEDGNGGTVTDSFTLEVLDNSNTDDGSSDDGSSDDGSSDDGSSDDGSSDDGSSDDGNSDDSSPSSSPSSSSDVVQDSVQEPELEENEDGSITLFVKELVENEELGEATVGVSLEHIDEAFKEAEENKDGTKKIQIEVPEMEGGTGYKIELPQNSLVAKNKNEIEIKTGIGSITLLGNMLGEEQTDDSENIALSLKSVDKNNLDEDVRAKIEGRPIIEINLNKDGNVIPWSNEDSPVRVSLPYTIGPDENPENIVVWYIDGEGNAIEVSNGRYDDETGNVVFEVNHFSKYAIGYVEKTFADLDDYSWAKHEIEVLAAKGIIGGVGNNCFAPELNITRADFIVLLVKTLGLYTSFEDNFDDVSASDYYYDEVGIAKALGIAKGVKNNKFLPKEYISRQDLIVLTSRALQLKGLLWNEWDNSTLDTFTDGSEIADYALKYVSLLVDEGLIMGNNNEIMPLSETKRAEAAALLYRIYNKLYN